MDTPKDLLEEATNRRSFMKGTGAAVGAGAIAAMAPNVHAQGLSLIHI